MNRKFKLLRILHYILGENYIKKSDNAEKKLLDDFSFSKGGGGGNFWENHLVTFEKNLKNIKNT